MSILIAAVAGAGWCLGWQPRAKVSMMIMRPPQQRQGRGSTRGSLAAAVADVSAGLERDGTATLSKHNRRKNPVEFRPWSYEFDGNRNARAMW